MRNGTAQVVIAGSVWRRGKCGLPAPAILRLPWRTQVPCAVVVIDAATLSSEDRARSLLDESLKDKNPDTRKQAVQALDLVGPSEPYILQPVSMLDDRDLEVRLATITSLVDLKNRNMVPPLQKAIDDDVPEASFAAANALDPQ